MKHAALVTLLVAVALFATLLWVENRLGLQAYRLGINPTYTEQSLTELIKADRSSKIEADRLKPTLVVVPWLFPLDLLFLLFFGASLALCSLAFADKLRVPPSRTGLLLVLPVAYMIADFSENVLYSAMLTWPETIGSLIDAEKWATRLKWLFVVPAMVQPWGAFALSRFR
jgi:hypothetical protein